MYTVQVTDPPAAIGLSTWAETEKRAAREGGWVAFKTDQSIAPATLDPVARQPGQLSPFETMATRRSVTTAPIFVSTQPAAKRKSLAAELFPVLALVIGIPMLLWIADRKNQRDRARRVAGVRS